MANDTRLAELEELIERDRGILDALKSGKLHEGDGLSLRGEGDRTKARIISLQRQIEENEKLLEFHRTQTAGETGESLT